MRFALQGLAFAAMAFGVLLMAKGLGVIVTVCP